MARMLNKKNLFFFIFFFVLEFIFIVKRSKVCDNELYVKLFSEKTWITFSSHRVTKDIIKEFKNIKEVSFIKYVAEDDECLLYQNEYNILHLLKVKEGCVVRELYKPKFEFKVDGKYVHFLFNDSFLNYVDGIMLRLNSEADKKDLYYIPVSTVLTEYEYILQIDKVEEIYSEKIKFEIEYTQQKLNY